MVGEVADTPGVHGFAIAPDLQRGFSSNGREAKAGIVDLKTLKTLSKVATGQNPDAILYEPGQKEVYAFSSNGGEGTVTIAQEDTPEKLTMVQTLATERGARTMALDPKTHRIYLGAVKYESQPNPTPATPRGRPRAVPNSFRILVYGQ